MKNRPTILFTSLVLSILACSVAGTSAPTSTPEAPTASAALSSGLTMQSSPVEEAGNEPPYTLKAQIPYLQGSADPRVQNFNSYLKQIVQQEIDRFKADTLAFASTPPLVGSSFLEIQYTVIGQSGEIWSVQFSIIFYADGAAHPGHYSISVNYDLANGRVITLDELFQPGSNYLQAIADVCKAELATRDIAFDGFSSGADPLPENYTRWNLSNEGFLVVTFDEYQVAPYAAGAQTVTIPFASLQSVSNPNGILSTFGQ